MKAPFIRLLLVFSQLMSIGLLGCATNNRDNAPTATAVAPTINSVPTKAPASVASPTASTLIVANTSGEGVFIRSTLSEADRIKAWPDDTVMVVIGQDQQAEGRTWKNVRDPDGNDGWVPAEYLVEDPGATSRPTPTVKL